MAHLFEFFHLEEFQAVTELLTVPAFDIVLTYQFSQVHFYYQSVLLSVRLLPLP